LHNYISLYCKQPDRSFQVNNSKEKRIPLLESDAIT
jgi:hypothetical protein